ncbi:MAG: hypothetical protein ACM3KM_00120 [Acidobacteriaceae bacterium]
MAFANLYVNCLGVHAVKFSDGSVKVVFHLLETLSETPRRINQFRKLMGFEPMAAGQEVPATDCNTRARMPEESLPKWLRRA